MTELRVANDHLADPARLRTLFAEDGYLFFRDVLDKDEILAVRRDLVRVLVECGMADSGGPEPAWTGPSLASFTEHGDGRLQKLYSEEKLWERLVAIPSVDAFFRKVVGGPVAFIPLARYRVMPPGGTTDIHQDGLLNPGFDMTAAWIPLLRIDEMLGGLAVVPGSHRHGYLATGPMDTDPGNHWRRAVYEPGDVVLMHEALLHAGLANRSEDGVRLSLDVRFQNPSAAPAVIGRITAVGAASISVLCDGGEAVTLVVDGGTLLRGAVGRRIPVSELPGSELEPGRRVLASRRGETAVVVKPL